MSADEIRVAIAEALGWTRAISPLQARGDNVPRHWKGPKGVIVNHTPNFPGDLNAAKDAAVKICDTEKKIGDFNYHLHQACGLKAFREYGNTDRTEFANNTASALDICTALLKALGIWKEGE